MKRIGSQSYKFNGTFDANGDVTLISVPGESGIPKAVCGDYSNFGGIGDATITIPFTMLNSQNGIYGANAGYSATYNGSDSPASSGTITNDVFGEIVGDLLTGINFGYLGSTVMFTNTANPGGIAIGDLSSVNWWGGKDSNGNTIAQSQTPYGNILKYGNVQSNPLNYNTYSNSVSPFTDAYTFAFEDRGGKVLLEFDTNTDPSAYLLVEMLPDGSSPGPGPTPGPTPGQTSVLPPYLLLEN